MKAFWEILRPFNCAMAAFAAIIGQLIAGAPDLGFSILVFLAVFLITGAGNAVNDYYDREIDAINRPGRPIPSGRVSPRAALNLSLALFAAGSALAGSLNRICLAVAVCNCIMLLLYARNLKATPLAGNISVAYLTGSTFLFGGAAQGIAGLQANLVPFLLSFLATMSREIAKDIEDLEGDRQGGALTLPILAGAGPSAGLAAAFALASVGLSFAAPFGWAYLALAAIADLFFLLSMIKVLRRDAASSQRALKIGMAVALMAFLAGALQKANILPV